jgi:alpha-tubulin suppressor-like RCC1 family protein
MNPQAKRPAWKAISIFTVFLFALTGCLALSMSPAGAAGSGSAPARGEAGVGGGSAITAWGSDYEGQLRVTAPNEGFVSVAAGYYHSMGLRSDGSLAAWGWNNVGQCDVPAPNSGFTAAAGGYSHSLGLRSDGTIAAWGDNTYNKCDVPAPNSGFTAVAVGREFSMALRSDGTIAAWGRNDWGQLNVPAPNSGFTAISSGSFHGLALRTDGTIAAWGRNDDGQLNIPAPNSGFAGVAAGAYHSLGLRTDGSLVACGWNNAGQCDVPAPNSGFTAASGGYGHSIAMRSDGSIAAWGRNVESQTSVPTPNSSYVAISAGYYHNLALRQGSTCLDYGVNDYGQLNTSAPNNGFTAVAAGVQHSLALRTDGTIAAWGRNDEGQCDVPAPNSGFVAVAAGAYHGLGLRSDGTIAAWGDNTYNQCDVPAPNTGYTAVAGGYRHSLGLRSDGTIVAWGSNGDGQLDVPAPNSDFAAVATGAYHGLGLRADGSVAAWGWNGDGQCDVPTPNTGYTAVAGGYRHSLGLRSDGTIAAWGASGDGQLDVPAPNYGFTAVAAGGYHSLGLRSDGSVAAWGWNGDGQCDVPAPNTGYTAVAGGYRHSLSLNTFFNISASISGGHGSVDPAAQQVSWGGEAAIDITVDQHYHIESITDNGTPVFISDPYVIQDITESHQVVVAIAIDTYAVNASVSGGHGSVEPAARQVDWSDEATIDITPDTGYHIESITDNGVPQAVADPYVISNVRETHDVVVTFGIDNFTVTASVTGGSGSVIPATQTVGYGSDATIDITPDPGYRIASITDNGIPVTSFGRYVIYNVNSDHTVEVAFESSACTVNASVFFWGHGSVDPATQSVAYGGTATIDLIPDIGYHASYILDNGAPVAVADPYVISNVRETHDVIAFFAPDTHVVTASVDGNGSVSGAGTYDYGATANLNALPAAGWHFVNWTEGGTEVSTDAAYSFTVTGARDLVAHFATVMVDSVMPRYIPEPGPVSITDLHGARFQPWARVVFTRAGSSDIEATDVAVVDQARITCETDFSGAAAGAWNVTVINPDGGIAYLANAFFVGTMSGYGWGDDYYGQSSLPDTFDYIAVAAGSLNTLALKDDGTLAVWGNNDMGQVTDTPTDDGYVAIAAGMYHFLALKADGSLAAWGNNYSSQCNVPAGNDFVAVAAGWEFSMALRADGSLEAWGGNDNHECDVPAGNDFTAIAAGSWHAMALRADGSLAAWGRNDFGQANVPAGNDYAAVDAGALHNLVVKTDGSLTAWGWNSYGQCNVPAGNDFTMVKGGQMHSIALRADGSIIAWGNNDNGQCNFPAGVGFTAVDAGGFHSLALHPFYEVDASVDGAGGSVDPATQRVRYGHSATIDLIPDANYHVETITDNGAPQTVADPYVIGSVRGNHDVEVTFALDPYTITATVDGNGSVSGAGTYGWGTEAVLTATPDAGWHFVNWTEGGVEVSTSASYSFTVTGARDLVAHFAIDTFAVNASVYYTGHGSVDPATQTINYGSAATIDLTPDTGYHVAYITDNGIPVTIADPYVISNVSQAHTVIVTFDINTYVIGVTADGEGSVGGGGIYEHFDTADLTATPDPGYHFVNWTEGGTEVSTEADYSFMVEGPRDLTAHFAINTYAVTASVSGGGGTVAPAAQTVDWGTDATINLTPAARYHIASITDNGASVPVSNPYVINDVTAAHAVVATFAPDTRTWYLAEGCTAGGTETWVLVENVNPTPVTLNVSFATAEGLIAPPELQGYVLAAGTRVSFDAGTYAQSYELSTIVSANGGNVVCERAMYGNSRTWGTDSIGTEAPAATWYLAEGSTGEGFETWVLVQNPGAAAVTVDLNFMTSAGPKAGPQDVAIPANTRKSFNLGEYVTDYDVSTVVTSTGGVVAERAMYGNGRAWAHDSIGTPTPADTWYLAEGSTGEGFETWVLVQNPNATPVTVDLTLMTGAGKLNPEALRNVTIPGKSRKSFNLGDYLTDYDVSTLVSATGGGVIAERSMYDDSRAWGTCSIGAAAPATTWYLAEGSTGEGFETFVLVQNPGAASVTVDLNFMTSTGPKAGPQDVIIPAYSRRSFPVHDYVTDYNVSTVVSATAGVVCERAMYGAGRTWAHDSVGYAP